ncbi:hypothetical protein TrRE_jg5948 [Triparma retinervis]|uniref:Uncharacterized protein n=1 Tax=Triparma retinervis TaxID=2557542 RepID=A0A9W7CHL9_9STRA|nr:hypothetical protein TrRE_jg5948 [Triparma retinervis]
MSSKTPLYKIVMLGDSGVGKTCLVCRLTNPNAVLNTDVPATMGIEFDTQLINTSVGTVKAQIWDTAGQERFARVLLPTYFRKAKGVLMVFDLTNAATLQSLETRWLTQMRDNADDNDLVKVLIGNKCDIASDAEIQKQAKDRRSNT